MKGKKVWKDISLTSLVGITLVIIGQSLAQNMVWDSSFEDSEPGEKAQYWKTEIEGKVQATIVADESHNGKKSLSIESSGEKVREIYKYPLYINPTTYRIGMAVKLSNIEISGYLTRLEIRLADGSKKPIFDLRANPQIYTWQGWHVYEGVFVPEEHGIHTQTGIEVVLERSGLAGKAWFDDIYFEQIRSPAPQLNLCPPKVEQGKNFTLWGTEFPFPGNVEIFLDMDTKKIAAAKTDTQGYFEIEITIPAGTKLGGHLIRAVCQAWDITASIEVIAAGGAGGTLNISGSSLNDSLLSSGETLIVRATAIEGAKATCNIEGMIEFPLVPQPGLKVLYEGEFKPGNGLKKDDVLVSVKFTKGNASETREIGRISINTVLPVIKPYEGPAVVKNKDTFFLAVKIEPPAENCKVTIDLSELDSTKKEISLPYCPLCATAGVYGANINISASNNKPDGVKKLLVVAIDSVGNKGQGEINIRLDNKGVTVEGPKIISLTFFPEKVLANQEITITLIGESGGKAKASIGETTAVALQEQQGIPGTYIGKFTPSLGTEIKDGIVSGELEKDKKTTTMEASKKISINTIVPEAAVSILDFDSKYLAGEQVHFAVISTPHCEIVADLSSVGLDSALKLVKDTSGLYQGSFTVPENIAEGKKTLIFTITSSVGNINSVKLEIVIETEVKKPEEPEIMIQKVKLSKGINLLSLIVNPGDGWRLSNLAKHIGTSLTVIIWYNAAEEKFISYLPHSLVDSPVNKLIVGGEAYIVTMKKEVEVVFTGTPWPSAAPGLLVLLKEKMSELETFNKQKSYKTQLLQNYPNPFNEETWIPFKLKEADETSITVYDVHGRVIRKIDLGYIPAGSYQTKARAAYWNGANDKGEKVSSGVYFYELRAGKVNATRKMVIIK